MRAAACDPRLHRLVEGDHRGKRFPQRWHGRSPCMGTSMSSTNFEQQSSFFLSYSFVRPAAEPILDDLRRACPQWAQRSRATSLYSVDPTAGSNHDAAMRIGGEAPRRQAHSFGRHQSHGDQTGHCHLGSSWHSSCYEAWDQRQTCIESSLHCFRSKSFMLPNAGRHRPGPCRS